VELNISKKKSPAPQVHFNVQSATKMATIVDFPCFDATADCEALHDAMKGFGTDEDLITGIITNRSNQQRQEMKTTYAQMWGKDLEDSLKSELGGNYEDVVLALFKKPDEYDATELRNALKGIGTKESVLIEILCTRTNEEIESIKEAYKRLFDRDLIEDIESDTSGYFKRLMFSLAQGNRGAGGCEEVCEDLAFQDAQALLEGGEECWGTDESRFNVILASRSFDQLRLTFDKYAELSEVDIEDSIKSEMSGDIMDAMLAVVRAVRSKPRYFARRLYKSMKGAGTDDGTLIRVMVSRSEVDMMIIKEHFERDYQQSLESFLQDDCTGDYRICMLLLAFGNM